MKKSQKRARRILLVTVAVILGIGVLLWGIFPVLGIGRPFRIPNESMSPALEPGDQVYMESISYWMTSPKRGA